jgi:hypothetical protein
MTILKRILRSQTCVVLFAVAISCALLPSLVHAQSSGSTVDECSSAWVDPYGDVVETVCLIGNQSELYASTETDSYNSAYVPEVDSQTILADNNGSFAVYSGFAVQNFGEQGGTDAYTAVSTTPTLNDTYTMYGDFGYCYDSSGQGGQGGDWWATGNLSCGWYYPGNYLSLQGEVTGSPTVTSLSPTSGAVGTWVTVTGTNFGSPQGASTVTFNGMAAAISSWSATSIVAVVPAGATTGAVVVTVNGIASNGAGFTVLATSPTLTVTSLSPSSGYVGLAVTIYGSSFGATQGQGTVTFNGASAGVLNWSTSSITAVVPSNATTGPVVVTLSNGQPSNNNVIFTVNSTSCN